MFMFDTIVAREAAAICPICSRLGFVERECRIRSDASETKPSNSDFSRPVVRCCQAVVWPGQAENSKFMNLSNAVDGHAKSRLEKLDTIEHMPDDDVILYN